MNPISVSIVGATGRLGSEILSQILNSKDFTLADAVVSPSSSQLGKSIGSTNKEFVKECFTKADVIIDASGAERLDQSIDEAKKLSSALLVLSTGHNQDVFKRTNFSFPFCYAPNTSYGVFLVSEAVRLLASQGRGEFSFHLMDTHHKMKKDAPSGTALMLSSVAKECGVEIEIQSTRGGTVAGEHELKMLGSFEEIVLTHRAQSRALFSHGALLLASRLIKMSPGSYSSAELFRSVR